VINHSPRAEDQEEEEGAVGDWEWAHSVDGVGEDEGEDRGGTASDIESSASGDPSFPGSYPF